MDIRRVLIVVIIVTFMAVTVGHVAAYAGSFEAEGWQWLGWPYALGVDVAIALCAWFTRWKTTRKWAAVGYGLCVAASGAMNLGAIKPWQQGESLPAWVYALFPTVAIALLGFLLRQVEGLGTAKKYQLRLQLQRPAFLRAQGKKSRTERDRLRSELSTARAEVTAVSARLEETLARAESMPVQFRAPRRDDFIALCTGDNGNLADLDARRVNQLLVTHGFYSVPDSTARDWAHKAQAAQEAEA